MGLWLTIKAFKTHGMKRSNISMLFICVLHWQHQNRQTDLHWPCALPLGRLTRNRLLGPEIDLAETHGILTES